MRKGFLIVLLFISCGFAEEFTHMKSPTVSDCSYGDGCIQITFSSEMEKGVTEQAFSCTCNDEISSGTFVWNEKKMCFYPDSGIRNKSRYEVEVGTRAEDKYGNSLKEVFSYSFSTIEKENKFFVQNINLSDGDVVADRLHPIEITFSKAVDQGAFYHGFMISPGIKGTFSFDGSGQVITFTPLENLSWNSTYTVTLKKSISDRYGNTLPSDYVVTFMTREELVSNLEKVCIKDGAELILGNTVNRGLEKDAELVLSYSGPVDFKTLRTPINISPVQDYSVIWNSNQTQCTITFRKPLPYKTLLELAAGEEKRYLLYVDGERSQPLAVQSVKFYQDYTTGLSEVLHYGCGMVFETGDNACFEFIISAGSTSEIFTADAYGAVDVAVLRGNLTIDLKHLETEKLSSGIICIRVFCAITAGTIQTPVIISVNGILKDSNYNTLGKDYVLRINGL